jgi:hypothetical protein
MQSKQLQWKEFAVDLEAVDAKFRADYAGNYVGNQAHSVLELYFEGELTEQMHSDIDAYWNGLTDQSADAVSYRSAADVKAAIETMKAGLVAKTWDQMSALERKLVIGQSVSKAELITAELL